MVRILLPGRPKTCPTSNMISSKHARFCDGKSFKSVVRSSEIKDFMVSDRDINNSKNDSPNGAEMATRCSQNAIKIEVGDLCRKIKENNSHWIYILTKSESKGDPKSSKKTFKMRSGKTCKNHEQTVSS